MSSKRRRFSGETEGEGSAESASGRTDAPGDRLTVPSPSEPVGAWKRQTNEGLAEVFSKGAERRPRDHESKGRDLHAKIGKPILQWDFLSRGSGR